jgi:hypothetical protein
MLTHRLSRVSRVVFSRRAGAIAGFAVVSILLGCMNFTFQDHAGTLAYIAEEGVACHEGTVRIPADTCVTVYYPLPFAAKPNLELTDVFDRCRIVQQREDGFEARNTSHFSATAEWRARGQKIATSSPPSVVAAPVVDGAPPDQPPAPATELPTKPLPAKP